MAIRGYANTQTGPHHRDDHAGAGIGFAATGRPLDRQHATVESEGKSIGWG